jgi:hypothetical protein
MFEVASSSGARTVGPAPSSDQTYDPTVPWFAMAQALFVVRRSGASQPGSVMFKVPLATYHAYSRGSTDGAAPSFYDAQKLGTAPDGSNTHTGYRITTLRPGGGTGAPSSIAADPNTGGTIPFNTFANWDARMISWLERPAGASGFDGGGFSAGTLDYCTDLDLHTTPSLLDSVRLLVSAGHDEYWSAEMRNNAEAFIGKGGNVGFFSGNNCFWRTYAADDNGDQYPDALVCDKRLINGSYTGWDGKDIWWRQRPENFLSGASSRNAGSDYPNLNGTGYTIQRSGEWPLAGTGLADGASLGTTDRLVNYETDGAAYSVDASGLLVPTGADGTPSTFRILGSAVLGSNWIPPVPRECIQGSSGCTSPPYAAGALSPYTATMGYYSRVGTVFTAATTDWSRVLVQSGGNVARITSNVVKALVAAPTVQFCADFNADGFADIGFVNPQSRAFYAWLMSGATPSGSSYADLLQVSGWNLTAAADMNGDGRPDLLWYNPSTGQIATWFMNALHVTGGAYVNTSQDIAWTLVSAADFNGDGKTDLIFQNRTTSQMAVWYMNGTSVVSGGFVTPSTAYKLITAVDLTGDGKTDLVFHNTSTGEVVTWLMTTQGINYTSGHILAPRTTQGWLVVGAGNFNVDPASRGQILLQNQTSRQLQLWVLAADGYTVTRTITLSAAF